MSYATATDYLDFTGTAGPADIDRLLDRASEEIDAYLVSARYTTDTVTGAATKPEVIDALLRATCAQVEWWQANGDELGTGAAYQTVSLGPASLTRSSAGWGPTPGEIAPRAAKILKVAGLITHQAAAW